MNKLAGQPLKVGLLGFGYAGRTIHAPLIACTQGLQLAAAVSSDCSKVHDDYPELTVVSEPDSIFAGEDIDLVVIATPNDTHFSLAKRALESGKHVVVDKPFTPTAVEARALIDLAQKQNLMVSVFQNRRWDADFLTVKSIIAEGKLGEIVSFESNFNRYRPSVLQRWREQPLTGSGLWFDLGSHLTDQAVCLFGAPDMVYGDLAIQRNGATAVDYFHVVLHYGQHRIILHASSLVASDTPRFSIFGRQGSYIKYGTDTQEAALKNGQLPADANWGSDPRMGTLYRPSLVPTSIPNLHGNYPAYYEAIRNRIAFGSPNPVPVEEALTVVRILEMALESSRRGKAIKFIKDPAGRSQSQYTLPDYAANSLVL